MVLIKSSSRLNTDLNSSLNFLDVTDFNVTFGNVVKRSDGGLLDVTEVIALAQSAATSVSMNASNWDRSAKDTSEIGKMLDGIRD